MPRRPIQQLPISLVNRIAAGEVIERPASVVKELVENALDAGATQITVEIADGGRELIRVIDNGSGIPPAELPLAFAPHATSKLSSDEDLLAIATMGFRGEALASIGAVSRARVLSRAVDESVAYEIHNRGGQLSDPQAAAGNAGTLVEVRDLFFNTPARRKFLKGSATEFGHISDAMLRLALPNPQIGFRLFSEGKQVLDLPAANPRDRQLAAWPEEFHAGAMFLDGRDAEIRIEGMIGLPELARSTPKYQFLYLNGRPIRDRFIMHALREAYRGLTEPGRHPAAVLMIAMPAGDVDVNVHPTKSEVRFRDGGRIHGLVMAAVREKLLGSNLAPTATMKLDAETEPRRELREKLAEFFKSGPDKPLAASQSSPAAPNIPTVPQEIASPRIPAIQLHNSYLVAESDDGLIIIDQHALHERIMYEELLARVSRGTLESQRMLIPPTLQATTRQMEMLRQIDPLLRRLGIEIEPFGPDSLAIQSFPTFLERLDPIHFVSELLERGEQELLDLHQEELLHEILDMMACKAAVKAGDALTPAEIEATLARRELIDRSSNCPHGRPTTLRLTLGDLEKQFKRTGF